jgi:hypothetical protein
LAVVLADARPAALLAPASLAVVLADARAAAGFALASLALVLADARPAALLAAASLAVVLADARPAAWFAAASLALVLAGARPAAWLAFASFVVVLADAVCSNPSFFALSLPLPFNFTLCFFACFRPLVPLVLAAPAFVLFFDYRKSALELQESALKLPPPLLVELVASSSI